MTGADTPVAKFFINCLAEEPGEVRAPPRRPPLPTAPTPIPVGCLACLAPAGPSPCSGRRAQFIKIGPPPATPSPWSGRALPGAARAAGPAGERHPRRGHQQHGARRRGTHKPRRWWQAVRARSRQLPKSTEALQPHHPVLLSPTSHPAASCPTTHHPPLLPPAVHPIPDKAKGLRPNPEAPGPGGAPQPLGAGGMIEAPAGAAAPPSGGPQRRNSGCRGLSLQLPLAAAGRCTSSCLGFCCACCTQGKK